MHRAFKVIRANSRISAGREFAAEEDRTKLEQRDPAAMRRPTPDSVIGNIYLFHDGVFEGFSAANSL